jgi:AbiV family abortive infection protein
MSYKTEFETVDIILNSSCITRGVDAFALSLIKAERQMRKLFTFLVYQNPKLQSQYEGLRETLANNRKVYFPGFIKGIETMYPIKIRDLIGNEYEPLRTSLLISIDDRNKIFHGQLTTKRLTTTDFVQKIDEIRKWCSLLSESSINEFGYDGFERNSMQKSEKSIYSRFLVKLESMNEYKEFINRYMVPEKKELSKEEIKKLNQRYYRINKLEIFKGIQMSAENASDQFALALQSAETKRKGLANSLLVLAAEESIKCFILLAVYFDIQVEFEMNPIFSKHSLKHVRGKELNDFVRSLSIIFGLLSTKRNETGDALIGILELVFGGSDDAAWWDQANNAKNQGLYVDYADNHFVSPKQTLDSNFETSEKIVGRFVRLVDKVKSLRPDDYTLLTK